MWKARNFNVHSRTKKYNFYQRTVKEVPGKAVDTFRKFNT